MTEDKELLTHQLGAVVSLLTAVQTWEDYIDDSPLWLHVSRAMDRAKDLMPDDNDE